MSDSNHPSIKIDITGYEDIFSEKDFHNPHSKNSLGIVTVSLLDAVCLRNKLLNLSAIITAQINEVQAPVAAFLSSQIPDPH